MRVIGLLAALSIAGCFSPEFQNVECGPAGECPPGHACDTATGICEKGADPGIDAGVNAPDADPGDPDAAPGQPDAEPGDPDADPGPACVLAPQDGCGTGNRCTIVGTGIEAGPFSVNEPGIGCAEGDDGGGDGEPCSWSFEGGQATDDCGPGLLCDDNPGECRPFCLIGDDQSECALGGGTCVKPEGGTLEFDENLGVCQPGG